MTGDPLYKVVTAYTPSQYREYNRTVQRVSTRVWLPVGVAVVVYVLVGIVLSYAFESVLWAVVFLLIGILIVFAQNRSLRRAEDAQYRNEQLAGTVTYSFYDDRVEASSDAGFSAFGYDEVTEVLERDSAVYVMFTGGSGALLPKEDMPPGLDGFLRSRFGFRRVRGVVSCIQSFRPIRKCWVWVFFGRCWT